MNITLSNNKTYEMPVNLIVSSFLSWLGRKAIDDNKKPYVYTKSYYTIAYGWTDNEIEEYVAHSRQIIWC